ncbi:MAG: hypothetical protein AAFZ52_12075 [Bacteroidota bacterium]
MQRLLLLLVLFGAGLLSAQDLYTVRVGVFRDVKATDFQNLRPLGFLYGITAPDQTTEVFVGQFSDQNQATKIAADLLQQGFRNAQAFSLPSATGQEVTVIQLALHSGNRPIEWASLERAGKLYVETVDGLTKIVTGVYPDGQTALQYLPAIRELGFRDAFVKKVNNVRLVPVGTFETGIKKPLIPIDLQEPPAATQTPVNPNPGTASRGPATYGNPNPVPNSVPAAAPTSAVGLPEIDGRLKRSSAADLQRVLKEKGLYSGDIDGYYGPGTTTAYNRAWNELAELAKFRLLAGTAEDAPGQWPSINVLLAVSDELAAGNANQTRAQQLVQQRNQLFSAAQKLSPVAATRAKSWASTVWANLDEWATEDPLHARILTAFRVAYHQTQVRLEDQYMDRGLRSDDARDLATAMLQNLVGADLDRFL